MPREREQPLSSARLGELLDLYSEGVTMSFVGGSDVGAYFRFAGRAVGGIPADVHIVGGRIVRPWGFSSEAIIPTRSEMAARDGTLGFYARCAERETRFVRWIADHAGRTGQPGLVGVDGDTARKCLEAFDAPRRRYEAGE